MIRHLCGRIPDKEWSGVLFYTVTGTFEEGLTVYCKDICLMDVGSATYTEFDTSPDIAGYMVENNLIDCYMGLVHSHNNMSTFFSGTDTNTLQEEGSYKNNFVSLIVNNAGSYTAAITRHVHSEITNNISFTYEMFGEGTKTGTSSGVEQKEYIEYFMLDVHKPDIAQNSLDTRINEILDRKRNAVKKSSWYDYKPVYNYDSVWKGSTEATNKAKAKQIDIPWEEKEFASKPADFSTIDKNALTVTMARLLTSSMTCNAFNIDLDSWIENYDKVYATKFASIVDYSEWLAPYMEYVMYHIPGAPTDIIDDVLVAVYANEIIRKIGTPKGAFSRELIDQLRFYGTD
jgi:hypothetical protein